MRRVGNRNPGLRVAKQGIGNVGRALFDRTATEGRGAVESMRREQKSPYLASVGSLRNGTDTAALVL